MTAWRNRSPAGRSHCTDGNAWQAELTARVSLYEVVIHGIRRKSGIAVRCSGCYMNELVRAVGGFAAVPSVDPFIACTDPFAGAAIMDAMLIIGFTCFFIVVLLI